MKKLALVFGIFLGIMLMVFLLKTQVASTEEVRVGDVKVAVAGNGQQVQTAPILDLTISSQELPWENLLQLLPPALGTQLQDLGLSGRGNITIQSEGPVDNLVIAGEFDLSNSGIRYQNIFAKPDTVLTRLAFEVGLKPGALMVTSLSLALGEFVVEIAGTVSNFQQPVLDLRLTSNEFPVANLLSFFPELTAAISASDPDAFQAEGGGRLQASAKGPIDDLDLALTIDLDQSALTYQEFFRKSAQSSANITVQAHLGNERVSLKELVVNLGTFRLMAQGTLSNFQAPDLDVVLETNLFEIEALLAHFPIVTAQYLPPELTVTGAGKVRLVSEGTLENLTISGSVDMSQGAIAFGEYFTKPKDIPGRIEFETILTKDAVEIRRVQINLNDVLLDITGMISGLQQEAMLDLSVTSNRFALNQVVPIQGMVGNITHVHGTLQGPLSKPTIRANTHVSDVDLVWLHADEIVVDVGYQGTILTLHQFRTRYQRATIEAHGTIDLTDVSDPRFDLPVKVHAGELAEYLMLFNQDLPITGTLGQIETIVHGSLSQLTAAAQASLVDGTAWDHHVDRLFGEVTLVENRVVVPSLTITKNDGKIELQGFFDIDTSFQGTMTVTDLNVRDIDAMQTMATQYEGQIDLSLEVAGTVADPQGSAHLSLNHLRYQGVPIHEITCEVSLAQHRMQATLTAFQTMLSASFEVTLTPNFPYRAELVLEQAALDRLLAFAGDMEGISGRITGRVTSEGSLQDLDHLSGEITLSELVLDISGQTVKNVHPIDLVMTRQKLVVNTFELQGEQLGVFAKGVVDFQGTIDLDVDGRLDLRLIQPFLPNDLGITSLGGRIQLLCRVAGTLQDPVLEGIAELHHGRVRIAAYPDPVTQINGRVTLAKGTIALPRLVGTVSQGRVMVRGDLTYHDRTPDHFTVTMTGERLVLAEVVEALTLTLSPSLTFSGDLQQQVLAGDLVIHEALYNRDLDLLVSNQERSIELITAETFGAGPASSGQRPSMTLDLAIKTGNNIRVRNKQAGLDLRADLRIKGTSARPQVTGVVEVVRGGFFVFNTRYEVLSARIDFFDPRRINPELNILLETLIREYTISVGLEGTLDRLDLTLSSTPVLSENEILELLLRGAGRRIVKGPILGWIERTTQDLFRLERVTLDTNLLAFQGRGSQVSPTLTLVKRVFDKLLLTYRTTVGGSEKFQIFQGEVEVTEKVSAQIRTNEKGEVDMGVTLRFYSSLKQEMKRNIVPIRPHRRFPRERKHHHKYPMNTRRAL